MCKNRGGGRRTFLAVLQGFQGADASIEEAPEVQQEIFRYFWMLEFRRWLNLDIHDMTLDEITMAKIYITHKGGGIGGR